MKSFMQSLQTKFPHLFPVETMLHKKTSSSNSNGDIELDLEKNGVSGIPINSRPTANGEVSPLQKGALVVDPSESQNF